MMSPRATSGGAQSLPSPGLVWGRYPQRNARAQEAGSWQRMLRKQASRLRPSNSDKALRRLDLFARESLGRMAELTLLEDAALQAQMTRTRAQIARDGLSDELAQALSAQVCETSRRVLGKTPYPVQLMAVRAMLDNCLAQMQTGEGKTLAVGLAAALAALAGVPVLVITANDYLVSRDEALMAPLFDALELAHAHVAREHSPEQRRQAYGAQICYCTAKELGFDYLRDQAALQLGQVDLNFQLQTLVLQEPEGKMPQPMLRGLCMAIIDEADSILLDEAITPLILSRAIKDETQLARLRLALHLARQLWPKSHYEVDAARQACQLTEDGKAYLADLCLTTMSGDDAGHLWTHQRFREELVCLALAALNLYRIDRDYVLREGEIQMIDQPTGRLAEGRKWSRGIHQLIELKEGLEPTDQTQTMAQISFQRLFPRFLRLSGVSGSLVEARAELHSIYRLRTVCIPLNKPSRRKDHAPVLHAHARRKWQHVLRLAEQLHRRGQPVLLGTDSVAASRQLSHWLQRAGLPHQMLTAAQDGDEAAIVARAGERGAITVTTNLAGRGTDIHVGAEVESLGGLAVIACHLNAERRIDRQLLGRSGRQGQAGSTYTILSLDDPLFLRTLPNWLDRLLRKRLAQKGQPAPAWLMRAAQAREESRASRSRLDLLENQNRKERLLAMAGSSE